MLKGQNNIFPDWFLAKCFYQPWRYCNKKHGREQNKWATLPLCYALCNIPRGTSAARVLRVLGVGEFRAFPASACTYPFYIPLGQMNPKGLLMFIPLSPKGVYTPHKVGWTPWKPRGMNKGVCTPPFDCQGRHFLRVVVRLPCCKEIAFPSAPFHLLKNICHFPCWFYKELMTTEFCLFFQGSQPTKRKHLSNPISHYQS